MFRTVLKIVNVSNGTESFWNFFFEDILSLLLMVLQKILCRKYYILNNLKKLKSTKFILFIQNNHFFSLRSFV